MTQAQFDKETKRIERLQQRGLKLQAELQELRKKWENIVDPLRDGPSNTRFMWFRYTKQKGYPTDYNFNDSFC